MLAPRLPLVLIALAVTLSPCRGLAQSITTGQIAGRVLTVDAEPLGQAHVTVTNLEIGASRTALTRADGTFTVLLLPPGQYDVQATFLGYRPGRIQPVRVTAGGTSTANLRLPIAAIEVDSVAVVADAQASGAAAASLAAVISREEIEHLPVLGRDFTDFIALASLVSPLPEVTSGGQFAIAGQRPSQTSLQVDGADANSAFFAENRGSARIPFIFSLESIREFQVITNGYDVEFGRYSGGVVNVLTRGGTNRFEATVFGNLRNETLTGSYFTPVVLQGDTIRRPRDYEVMQYGARISGPVLRNRLHYLASIDGQRRREPFTPLTPDVFAPRGDTVSATAMTQFITVLQNQYGIGDAGRLYRPFLTTNDVITLFGRVDYMLRSSHRLSLRHNFAAYSNDREPGAEAVNAGLSATEHIENVSHSLVAELQSIPGTSTSNVFRLQFAIEGRPRTALEQRPELRVALPIGELQYGGNHIAFQNRLDERKLQLVDNFTWQIGDHTLKLGGSALWTHVRNRFIGAQAAGTYRFNSLDDFESYRPISYIRRQRAGGELPRYAFTVQAISLYAQHAWQVLPRLTATLGLRYEAERFADEPSRVTDVETGFGIPTGTAPADANNFSPRLALVYDVHGGGRTILRGGVGYLYGTFPYALGGAVFSTERPVLSLVCQGSTSAGAPNAPPSPREYAHWDNGGADNPTACSGSSTLAGIPEYNLWNPGFQIPETLKANVGWEQQILRHTRLVLDLLYSRGHRLYTVRNLNLNEPQFELGSENGRQVFTPTQFFTPQSGAAQTRHRRFASFSNVLVNTNGGISEATQLNAELLHRVGTQTTLRGSYTFSRAYDNSSFNCCAVFLAYASARMGRFGPNEFGVRGDTQRGWGESDFNRRHTFVLSGQQQLPHGLQVAAIWRIQSGTPWTPELGGDVNGDGVNFNDRPYVFSPAELPLDPLLDAEDRETQRERYAGYLSGHACLRQYSGRIIPRNTCRNPTFNRLDVSLGYSLPAGREQRAELVLDLFNVLNLLNDEWGRYRGVTAERRSLLAARGFLADRGGTVTYRVPTGFAEPRELGSNLMLQWQAQLSIRFRFMR